MRAKVSAHCEKQFVGAATNAAEYAMSWHELLQGGRGRVKYLTNMFEVTNYRCCLLQKYLCIESICWIPTGFATEIFIKLFAK